MTTILLLDSGNTRLKLRVLNQANSMQALAHHDLANNLMTYLDQLPCIPSHVIGVNVAGNNIAQIIDNCLTQKTLPTAQWLQSSPSLLGLNNLYHQATQLGADRWFSALAAWSVHPNQASLVASFGTATTIDTLSPSGDFCGGLILPGCALMQQSLHQKTANLPYAQNQGQDPFPKQTEHAIMQGIINAQLGALRTQFENTYRFFSTPPKIYLCGGAVNILYDALLIDSQYWTTIPSLQIMEHAVLDGLTYFAQATI